MQIKNHLLLRRCLNPVMCVCVCVCVGMCVCVCACARKHMCVRNSEKKKPSVSPKGGGKGLMVTIKEQVVARMHSIYVCVYVRSTYVCMSAYQVIARIHTQYICMYVRSTYVCMSADWVIARIHSIYVCMCVHRKYVCMPAYTDTAYIFMYVRIHWHERFTEYMYVCMYTVYMYVCPPTRHDRYTV